MSPPATANPPAPVSGAQALEEGANREQRIARAAYLLSERDGFPSGRDMDYWLQAESDVDGGSAKPKR